MSGGGRPLLEGEAVARAAEAIKGAEALLITAGAGIGVDSGLPDFRGNEGFWKAYPALSRAGFGFSEIANPDIFGSDPTLSWGFYGHRLMLYRNTEPHAGFGILRKWSERTMYGAAVFTSNVDGQFQKAGFQEPVAECHGSIGYLQCTRPCMQDIWPAEDFRPAVDEASCRLLVEAPRCPSCGAIARPNILMFGDGAWISSRTDEQEAELANWLEHAERLVIIEIGAGRAIPTVRRYSESILHRHDAVLVRINPRDYEVPRNRGIGIAMPALAAIETIDANISRG